MHMVFPNIRPCLVLFVSLSFTSVGLEDLFVEVIAHIFAFDSDVADTFDKNINNVSPIVFGFKFRYFYAGTLCWGDINFLKKISEQHIFLSFFLRPRYDHSTTYVIQLYCRHK